MDLEVLGVGNPAILLKTRKPETQNFWGFRNTAWGPQRGVMGCGLIIPNLNRRPRGNVTVKLGAPRTILKHILQPPKP